MARDKMLERRFFLQPDDPPAKQAILQAALHLFVRDGLCATSIRAIADEAGYTNPALFKHFDSKDALALYLFEQCYRRYARELSGALKPEAGFGENLHALLQRFAMLFDEEPEAFLFMQDNLRQFWPRVGRGLRNQSLVRLVGRLLEQGRAQGEVCKDVSVAMQIAGVTGLLAQFARLMHFGELPRPARARVEELERLVSAMLRT